MTLNKWAKLMDSADMYMQRTPVSLSSSYFTLDLAGISITACISSGAFSPMAKSCHGCEDAVLRWDLHALVHQSVRCPSQTCRVSARQARVKVLTGLHILQEHPATSWHQLRTRLRRVQCAHSFMCETGCCYGCNSSASIAHSLDAVSGQCWRMCCKSAVCAHSATLQRLGCTPVKIKGAHAAVRHPK